ncbi:ABC transporter ATP-binding protein [Nocardioides halotolerans]|uniref:ABC transporter ATP-binding protein n=1 Tax=Nocardioides halotolerans TaxID=433660 RepID=UPI000561399B|nr:ABC transporter ATP-binding protein [Nocardioides halotolerans]
MVNNLVEVRGLTVVRDRPVLDGLDVTIGSGVTGLLGPSGCGKSTLLRAIVGVQQVQGGTVTVLGQRAGSAGLRSRIGYVTQEPSVYDDLTVVENLRFFARVLGCADAEVDAAIDAVDLGSHADARVGRLSGGQRSRASLAVALLGAPDLLVLDEPTVGLDPVLRRDLWMLFHRLADEGAAVLVSSHVMDEAERCDQLLLMREGAILAHDTPEAIKRQAGTADVESAFLALVEDAS